MDTPTTATPAIKMEPVKSSQLDSVGHDPVTNTLAVRFKPGKRAAAAGEPGSLYHYDNVSAEQFASFQAAESFNKAFSAAVKDHPDAHPYRKITEAALG